MALRGVLMKHIIFVKGLTTEEDREKVQYELENTRIEFTISTATSSVTVSGSNDVIHSAKQAIIQAGYVIQ